jgi:hypothetical protein
LAQAEFLCSKHRQRKKIPLKLKMKYPANITGDVSNFISNVILHVKKTNLNPLEEPKKIM